MDIILFHGNDFKLVRKEVQKYEEKIKKEYPLIEQDTPENPNLAQIYDKVTTQSLFSEKQLIKIFEPEKVFDNESLKNILKRQSSAILFLISSKDSNPFKKAKGLEVLTFNLPRHYEIEKILVRRFGKKINPAALDYLSKTVTSLIDIDELEEKMKNLDIHFLDLKTLSDFNQDSEAQIFLVIDTIFQKKTETAILEVNEFLQGKDLLPYFLGTLFSQLEKLLMVRKLWDNKKTESEIASILGGHPFVAKKILQTSLTFSRAKLENLILSLSKTAYQTRFYDSEFVPYFIEKLIFEITA